MENQRLSMQPDFGQSPRFQVPVVMPLHHTWLDMVAAAGLSGEVSGSLFRTAELKHTTPNGGWNPGAFRKRFAGQPFDVP
jgi:hypothetical protein